MNMQTSYVNDFVELVEEQYGHEAIADTGGWLLSSNDPASDAHSFDRMVQDLSYSLKIDFYALIRLYGERWIRNNQALLLRGLYEFPSSLACMHWLLRDLASLREANIPGIGELKALPIANEHSLYRTRVYCHRRCWPFLEGVFKGLAREYRENVRYMRKPIASNCCELIFKTI